jgi:hypothetical protein
MGWRRYGDSQRQQNERFSQRASKHACIPFQISLI